MNEPSCSKCPGCEPSSRKRRVPWGLVVLIIMAALIATVEWAHSEVFYSKESALRMAFPEADSIETRHLVLDAARAQRVEERAGVRLDSRLVNLYVGRREGAVVGYAMIETHTVRSLPETILVVISADGRSHQVYLLAFHEPREYMPSGRWLRQFEDRRLDEELALRRGVVGITGATLTASAITAAVRRALAIQEVVVGPAPSGPPPDQGARGTNLSRR